MFSANCNKIHRGIWALGLKVSKTLYFTWFFIYKRLKGTFIEDRLYTYLGASGPFLTQI